MSEKRNYTGRLDMDVVRGTRGPPLPEEQSGYYSTERVRSSGYLLQQRQEHLDYTAEWVNRVELPERAHSTCPVKITEPIVGETRQRVTRSAPALSIKSGVSNRSTIVKTKLELELKHLKEKQRLDQEQRELHLEMQRHEMEQRKKLAELEERRRLHELEVRLAETQMQEQLEHDEGDPDSRSNRGDDYPERLDHLEEQVDHPIAASGMNNNIETSTEGRHIYPRSHIS